MWEAKCLSSTQQQASKHKATASAERKMEDEDNRDSKEGREGEEHNKKKKNEIRKTNLASSDDFPSHKEKFLYNLSNKKIKNEKKIFNFISFSNKKNEKEWKKRKRTRRFFIYSERNEIEINDRL